MTMKKHHNIKLNFSYYMYDKNMYDVTHDLYSSLWHKLSHFLRPIPWSMTYFIDGPSGLGLQVLNLYIILRSIRGLSWSRGSRQVSRLAPSHKAWVQAG